MKRIHLEQISHHNLIIIIVVVVVVVVVKSLKVRKFLRCLKADLSKQEFLDIKKVNY